MSTNLDALRRYAADHHGVVTGAAAAALGVRAVELLELVLGGEFELIANDVYRLFRRHHPLTEYAEAVALAGPGAVLADDAVLAMHDLASVNPRPDARYERRTMPRAVLLTLCVPEGQWISHGPGGGTATGRRDSGGGRQRGGRPRFVTRA